MAFLAAWCIGTALRARGADVVAAAILLECHTLVVREPGAAKNDLTAAALLLAAIAILVEAWSHRERPVFCTAMRTKDGSRSDRWRWAAGARRGSRRGWRRGRG